MFPDAVEVAVSDPSGSHAGCYRTAAGAVGCWGGSNVSLNFVGPQPGPWPVTLPAPATRVVAWSGGHCAVLADGGVACWRGHGGKAIAARVAIDDVVDLAGESHLCAVRRDGGVWCWGDNPNGELGVPPAGRVDAPAAVPGVTDAVTVAAGVSSTCVTRRDGSVWCWGAHPWRAPAKTREELLATVAPVEVPALRGARRVAIGVDAGCVVLAEGALSCQPAVPRGATDLAMTYGWGCGVVAGDVWCFGHGPSPGLVDASARREMDARAARPWKVAGLRDAVDVSVWVRHACAVGADGRVGCWGYNDHGELGDGTVDPSPQHATWVVAYAPVALPEPRGGVYGCTADLALRTSCRQMGSQCRLSAPPGYWSTPGTGVEYPPDDPYWAHLQAELSERGVPPCMCTCTEAYVEADRAWQEKMDAECCPP
ncbi:MAG: RCC1 domain-containing protein [Myxococcota bacterium]